MPTKCEDGCPEDLLSQTPLTLRSSLMEEHPKVVMGGGCYFFFSFSYFQIFLE